MTAQIVRETNDGSRVVALRVLGTVIVLLGITACVDNGPRPLVSSAITVAEVLERPQLRSMSVEERQIVDSLVLMFPQSAHRVRTLLSDRRVAAMELPGTSAMALLAKLDSIRSTGGGASFVRVASPATVPAKVVIVDELDDSTADVLVVRRTRPATDMIVMAEKKARGATLGAGIAALFKLRKQFGDSATQDMHLVIRDARMPKKWPASMKLEADRLVARLRKADKEAVRGIGQARTVEIPLVATGR